MRTLKLYLHGMSMGTPPSRNDHIRTPRGECGGWTSGATRRNVAFLRSVEPGPLLSDQTIALAVTLTVRDCPPTADDWSKLRKVYLDRLRRSGLVRGHWVTEWQRRGAPHLHGAFWFSCDSSDLDARHEMHRQILQHWLDLTKIYGATRVGQHITPIYEALGWFQYVAKHAARGVKHYQRSMENVPAGWRKTGRVWGKVGDFALREAMNLEISSDVYYRFRRVVRRWRIADARAARDSYRLTSARAMLKCSDRAISEVRGVSEWIDMETSLTMLDAVRAGGSVSQ